MIFKNHNPRKWRDYQKKLQNKKLKRHIIAMIPLMTKYAGCLILLSIIATGVYSFFHANKSRATPTEPTSVNQADTKIEKLSGMEFQRLFEKTGPDALLSENHFALEHETGTLTVNTFLEPVLQRHILKLLEHSRTIHSSVVILNPNDGSILAMASYSKNKKPGNLCINTLFPAASLFKIISAAAALETAGFTPDKTVFFEGGKHTLYKRQLKAVNGRYCSKTSFRRAFASSINSVFGKLGIFSLGKNVMNEYAEKFYFNKSIPFDFPVKTSGIQVPDDKFGLAEIASGFNKKTIISPLHAALIASAVVNNGIMMMPRLVENVTNKSGEILFDSPPAILASPISIETAKGLRTLMDDTILYGTCRRSLKPLLRKKAFKNVELGAKTGTINNETDQLKYDWLVTYAIPRNRAKAICIAVLSVHGKMLGTRANELGRYILNYYFT